MECGHTEGEELEEEWSRGSFGESFQVWFYCYSTPVPCDFKPDLKESNRITWALVKSLKIEGRILFSNHIKYMPILKRFIHSVLFINL